MILYWTHCTLLKRNHCFSSTLLLLNGTFLVQSVPNLNSVNNVFYHDISYSELNAYGDLIFVFELVLCVEEEDV